MKAITLLFLVFTVAKGYSQSDLPLYGYVDSATFKEAEVHPAPVGGLAAWDALLKKEMRSGGTRGTVIVEFTVNKDDHAPSKIKIYRSDNTQLNSEAIRIIKKSRWTPALESGNAVNYRMRQEIEFN
jgi:TonB family protein